MDEPVFDPFFHVRKGGPKEKRIRRVELMGEHSPKPIYYIKVSQSIEDDLIDDEIFHEYFSEKYVLFFMYIIIMMIIIYIIVIKVTTESFITICNNCRTVT